MSRGHPAYPNPRSFSPSDEFIMRLPLVPSDILLKCVLRFRESIPKGHRTKMGYTSFIKNDFARQANQLTGSSTQDLLRHVSPPAGHPTLRLPLVCRFIHNRYGPVVASQLLCSQHVENSPMWQRMESLSLPGSKPPSLNSGCGSQKLILER